MKEKIIDSLKGVTIGDAFWVGLESKSRPLIKENVHFDKYVNVWRGKTRYSPEHTQTIYGLNSLPQFLLEQTEGLTRMETPGEKLYNKFSKGYAT